MYKKFREIFQNIVSRLDFVDFSVLFKSMVTLE